MVQATPQAQYLAQQNARRLTVSHVLKLEEGGWAPLGLPSWDERVIFRVHLTKVSPMLQSSIASNQV